MYHNPTKTQESKSTRAADWRGKRHARMTRSMFDLPAGPFKVLAGLRIELKDGETRDDVSQAMIADLANVSEATVSRAMPILQDAGFIQWTKHDPDKRGRGAGHTLTLLPPPEMGSAADPSDDEGSATQAEGSHLQEKGSFLQDAPKYPMPPIQTPQTAASEGSSTDPYILMIHAVDPITTNSAAEYGRTQPEESVGGGGSATRQKPAPAGAPTITESERLLIAYGLNPKNAHKLAHLDPAVVRAGLKRAERLGTGPGGVFASWKVCPPEAPAPALPERPVMYRPTGPVLTPAERAAWARENNPFAVRGAS